jgi:hypothetical protein
MAADSSQLESLVAEIGRFYVRDKALRRAQATIVRLLAEGDPPAPAVEAYLRAVRHYFEGFEREARAHLKDVDRRLARVSQLQFNLTAERGVTLSRVEATQGVLSRVAELGAK